LALNTAGGVLDQPCLQPRNDMATALVEAKAVMTGAVGELLAKTGRVWVWKLHERWWLVKGVFGRSNA